MKFVMTMLVMGVVSFATPRAAVGGEAFHPDNQPSARMATVDLAQQMAEVLLSIDAKTFDVRDDESSRSQSPLFISTLRELLPGVEMRAASSPVILLNLESTGKESGRLSARIDSGASQTLTVAFDEKPWAADWVGYINADPKNRWILGRSPSPAVSSAQALTAAQKSCVDELTELVRAEMNARAKRNGGARIIITRDWIARLAADSLQRNAGGLLVRDTFVQRFQRPYGDVWQASILVDASPEMIGRLVESYSRVARSENSTRLTGFATAGAMAVVLVLLYAFTNAVTKGYFMWRLRAGALLAAIAGVLIVFTQI